MGVQYTRAEIEELISYYNADDEYTVQLLYEAFLNADVPPPELIFLYLNLYDEIVRKLSLGEWIEFYHILLNRVAVNPGGVNSIDWDDVLAWVREQKEAGVEVTEQDFREYAFNTTKWDIRKMMRGVLNG